jgi:hypothetical protein
MAGNIEAAADLVTGAMWGRAAEPHGDDAHAGPPAVHGGALCLNCGTRLIGAHCHACGQSGHVHKTVGAIGHEIAHGVFHFEGKVWRTLPMLVWRPGELTRRYVDGERARFVSPLALFLFTVFLLFATISWVGGDMAENLTRAQSASDKAEIAAQLDKAHVELAKAEAGQRIAARAHQSTAEIDTRVSALRTTVRGLELMRGQGGTGGAGPFTDVHTGWAKLDHGIAKANANPGLAIYKLQSSAYKYSWVLIPLSTPVVALLFLWRRRFGLYDHAIFVTFSIAFMMILVTAVTLAGAAGLPAGWIVMAMLLVPPIHIYKQLRGTYRLRRLSAGWRMVALVHFASLVLAMFTCLLLLHGLTE